MIALGLVWMTYWRQKIHKISAKLFRRKKPKKFSHAWCYLYLASFVFLFILIGGDPWTGRSTGSNWPLDFPITLECINMSSVEPKYKRSSAVHGSRPIGLLKIQILISLILTLEHQITTNTQAKDDQMLFLQYLLAKHCRKCQIKILLVTLNYFKKPYWFT